MPRKLSINEMYILAKSRNGKCLSKKYVDNRTDLKWECENKHVWKARPGNVKNGTWCPFCAAKKKADKKKYTIQDMQIIANEKGGECLSTEIIDAKTHLKWRCSKGHIWYAIPYGIKKKGWWCPICSGKAKLSLSKMKEVAESRLGKCLSKKYVNTDTKLEWECKEGHRWFAKYDNIRLGQWCPVCKISYSEEICRITFEEIFGDKFIKVRPSWLRNDRGNLMELDGYSKKFNIAFEYQGEQHFKKNRYNKNNKEVLKIRIKDDKRKKLLCSKNKIHLIIITYLDNLENLPLKIKEEMLKFKISIKSINFNKKIDFDKIYRNRNFIEEMNNLAKKNEGICLSKKYFDAKTKYKWRCKNNHIFKTTLDTVKKGSWCRLCGFKKTANSKKLGIELMNSLAKNNGGKCLSEIYYDIDTKLEWQCKKGHIWKTTPYVVKTGSWCPECSGTKKLTIDILRDIAETYGGELLSKKYINNHSKLKWKCMNGHTWFNTSKKVKNLNKWCPECEKIKKTKKNNQILEFLNKGFTDKQAAKKFSCSESKIYKLKNSL